MINELLQVNVGVQASMEGDSGVSKDLSALDTVVMVDSASVVDGGGSHSGGGFESIMDASADAILEAAAHGVFKARSMFQAGVVPEKPTWSLPHFYTCCWSC